MTSLPARTALPTGGSVMRACAGAKALLHGGTQGGARGTGNSRGLAVLLLALLLSSGCVMPAWGGQRCVPEAAVDAPQLQQVSPHVWRVAAWPGEADPHNRGRVTQLVVVNDGSRRWLVGSGPTPAFGAALLCATQPVLNAPVSDVVNTRAHPELALGNVAFEGARVWALADVARAMARQCAACLERLRVRIGEAGASLQHPLIRVPTHQIARAGSLHGRLGPFRWWALPLAPGRRTLLLAHGPDKVVIAQGLVWVGAVPNLREADSALLLGSLQALRKLAGGHTLLGEQGEPGTAAEIDRHIAYLVALRAAVQASVARGDAEAAGLEAIELPQFAQLAGYATLHPLNRQRVWREAEAALFK